MAGVPVHPDNVPFDGELIVCRLVKATDPTVICDDTLIDVDPWYATVALTGGRTELMYWETSARCWSVRAAMSDRAFIVAWFAKM